MAERRPTRAENALGRLVLFVLGAVAIGIYAMEGRRVFRYFAEGVPVEIRGVADIFLLDYFIGVTTALGLAAIGALIFWLCWALGEPDKPRADDPWSEPGD